MNNINEVIDKYLSESYIIKTSSGIVFEFDDEKQIVQTTNDRKQYKIFRSKQDARKFIEEYADAGYGLLSKDCKILFRDKK